ncbi:DUF7574 domain-containing protein [Streptomyces tsukubensis]|uniref:DUF7574 domain-containing protein n=1 Tax=Streptomyces tsukubensis TaxID=83656 RepID=UPI00344F78DF
MGMYYSPEMHGALIVGNVDTIGGYEFNMLAVFQRVQDGALFFETDSGCSCFSPFESASWDNMQQIHSGAWFAGQARAWLRNSYNVSPEDREAIEKLIAKVRAILKGTE